MRVKGFPAFTGIGSESAAHRIAVNWTSRGVHQSSVYIPRRNTSSILNSLAGGRFFFGYLRYTPSAVMSGASGNAETEIKSDDFQIRIDNTLVTCLFQEENKFDSVTIALVAACRNLTPKPEPR